jgi:hypothetical protein
MSEIHLPADFETQMRSLLGKEEFENFKSAINRTPRTSIRLNPAKPFSPAWPKSPITWSSTGFYLDE